MCYIPDSPFNLFSVTEFGKTSNSSDQDELTEGTSIQTFARHSVFTWDKGQHQRTFVHPPNSLPMLSFNNGYKVFNAFCSAVQDADINELKSALTSSQHEIDEEAEDVVSFIEALQVVINRNEGDTNLDVFMK